MQDALGIVVVAVVGAFAVAGVAMLVLSRGAYDRIGRSGLTIDRDDAGADADSTRDAEIASMLEHSNAWRAAHGRPPLSLADLDPSLRDEVRAAVEASNSRRVARGLEPLDVDAEVDRRLSG